MGELLFIHFRVKNVKLINEKDPLNSTARMSVNPSKLIPLLRFLQQYVLELPRYAQK